MRARCALAVLLPGTLALGSTPACADLWGFNDLTQRQGGDGGIPFGFDASMDAAPGTDANPTADGPPADRITADAGGDVGPDGADGGCPSCSQTVVLFGGETMTGFVANETWTYDNNVGWQMLNPTMSPGASADEVMALWEGHILYAALGSNGNDYTWVWNGSNWTMLNPSQNLTLRSSAAMALLPNNKVLVFGGVDFSAMNDTWIWDGATWTQINPVHYPGARSFASAVALNGEVVLFGGLDGSNNDLGDTWVFDPVATDWTQITTSLFNPSARAEAAFAVHGTKAVLFGGSQGVSTVLADTWEWDGASWTQQFPPPPPKRSGAAAASFNGRVLMFGGQDETGTALGDTWDWDGSNWTQKGSGPSARFHASMCGYP